MILGDTSSTNGLLLPPFTAGADSQLWPPCDMSAQVPACASTDPARLQVEDYQATSQQLDPMSAPEKQAKVAIDGAIATGDMNQVRMVLSQVAQHLPQRRIPSMMHALRSSARAGNLEITRALLEEIKECRPQEVFDIMRYALDGAAAQQNPSMLEFLLGALQNPFQSTHPQQFHQLVQHSVNAAAKQGNLILLKFLMDHTAAASITIDYQQVLSKAVESGQAEALLKEAIKGGAPFENVILMLLQIISKLPESNDSSLGSRQSLKTTAKLQLVRSYKQSNPPLFENLMAAVKSFFPEESSH